MEKILTYVILSSEKNQHFNILFILNINLILIVLCLEFASNTQIINPSDLLGVKC